MFLGNAFIKKMIFESRFKKLIYLNTHNILLKLGIVKLVRSVELLVLVTELISFISVVGLVFFEEKSELNPELKLLGLVPVKMVLVPVKVVLEFVIVVLELVEAVRIIPL